MGKVERRKVKPAARGNKFHVIPYLKKNKKKTETNFFSHGFFFQKKSKSFFVRVIE